MTTEAEPVEAQPGTRGGIRMGVWALALAVGALVWAAASGALAIWAMSDTAPAPVSVIAYVLFLLGFFVIPVASVASVILGIAALVRNRVAGKVLGGIAVLLGLGVGAFVVSLILGSGGFFGALSF